MTSVLNNTVSYSKNTGIAYDNDQYRVLEPLSADEYAALKADIRENGVRVPVVIDEQGTVIDGHHRIEACRELDIEDYPTQVRKGLSDLEKRALARSLNAQRRQMEDGDKRDLIEQALLDYDGEGIHRTDDELAQECGTSQSWVNDVRHRLVEDGQITTSGYLTESAQRGRIRSAIDDDPDESDYSIGKRLNVSKNTVASVRKEKESETVDIDDIDVIHDDFREVDIEPESIDHIVTDPPYGEEYLDLWSDLSELAAHVLKPGGFVIAYAGISHLPDVFTRLGEQLEWYWQMVVTHDGANQTIYARNLSTKHRPVIVYQKPPHESQDEFLTDLLKGNGRDKSHHKWQQSQPEFEKLIDGFTNEGDTVLDPMAGSGTTLLACYETNREAVGIEVEKDAYDTIHDRLSDVESASD
jgi:16S rRNA G966 N2-methylase RsmD